MSALKKQFCRSLITFNFIFIIAACSSGVKLDDVNTSRSTQTTSSPPINSTQPEEREVKAVTIDPLSDPNNPLSKRSIYFAFDSYVIDSKYKETLDAHASYLTTHPQQKMLIQGNTDERGTTEYNLALGQKRAEAVRRSLALLGVPDTQMEAVSLGKEKPNNLEHNEAAWQENRRADILY